jgi:hypothetical protein
MRQFSDSSGRPWSVRGNATALAALRDQAGIDFLNVQNIKNVWAEVLTDPLTLSKMLVAVCGPQVRAAGLTVEDFTDGLSGEVLKVAAAALAEEINDFFLGWQPAVGQLLQQAYRAHLAYMDRTAQLVQTKLSRVNMNERVDQATKVFGAELDRELSQPSSTDGGSCTNSPECSESGGETGRSPNSMPPGGDASAPSGVGRPA